MHPNATETVSQQERPVTSLKHGFANDKTFPISDQNTKARRTIRPKWSSRRNPSHHMSSVGMHELCKRESVIKSKNPHKVG